LGVKTNTRISLALVVLLGSLACVPSSAQDYPKPKNPFNTLPLYKGVLDILFSCERPPGEYNLFVTLRSFSSARYESESQICILQDVTGNFRVVQYYTPSGSESIWDQLNYLYFDDKLHPNDNPAKLAKRFKAEVRTVEFPPKVLMGLLNELIDLGFPSIHLDPPEKQTAMRYITVDGVSYEFSYSTTQSEMHIDYSNPKSQQGNVKLFGEWLDRLEAATNSAPAAMARFESISARTFGKPRSGLILGNVADAAHVDVAGASVTVTDKKTNARIATVRSDARGEFVVPEVQPGEYTVRVEVENPRIRFVQDVSIQPAKQTYLAVVAEGRVSH
jgi:hypothetical protein